MEPLAHYHGEIYYCKPVPINLHQTTCIDNLCEHVPYINLYHKKVHQPCTKPVQITCHNNLSKQPITTTSLINLINQIRSTHQDQSPRQLSTICTISPRCASTKHVTTTHFDQQDQYVLLIIYQYKYATSSINHVSTILLTSAQLYTSCMCQLINYLSQPCTQHVPQPKSLIHEPILKFSRSTSDQLYSKP
jgi:hypothetical protein